MNEHLRLNSRTVTTQAAEGLPRRAWSVTEIEALVGAGIIAGDERFELIGGEIVPMSPKGAHHEWIKRRLDRHLQRTVPATIEVATETTVYFDDDGFLEPDFSVFAARAGASKILASDLLLAIEVADTSLAYDLGRKIEIYAAYEVREVWVINALTLVTRVHRAPVGGAYSEVVDVGHETRLVPGLVPELAVRLADIGLRPSA